MSTQRPILFSGPMVRAILEGRKTQTRRIIKDATGSFWDHRAWKPEVVNGAITHWVSLDSMNEGHIFGAGAPQRVCPYGKPGDQLWVRESCYVQAAPSEGSTGFILYKATDPDAPVGRWTPSIHMPRWASRINLEVVSVRVERLNDITEEDAIAEGVPLDYVGKNGLTCTCKQYKCRYVHLWIDINGPGSWDANPWVWVVTFNKFIPQT